MLSTMALLILLSSAHQISLYADINSSYGQIKFDVNSDSNKEMILNATGLGIGLSPSANLHVAGNALISNTLSIGGVGSSSNLHLNGTLGLSAQTVISDTTLDASSLILADTTNGNVTLSLPAAASVSGRVYTIKKTSTQNSLWILSSDNIDQNASGLYLGPATEMPYVEVMSFDAAWYILSKSSSTYPIIASSNLVSWYKFDETSGTIALDSSPNQNTASLVSLDFSTNGNTGKFGHAIQLSSTSDYVDANNPSQLSSISKFSISVWVKFDSTSTDDALVTKGNSWGGAPPHFLLWRDDVAGVSGRTNTLSFFFNDGSGATRIEGASDIVNDTTTWHHIVATAEVGSPTGMRLYLDGIEDPNSPVSMTTRSNLISSDHLRIGGAQGNTSAATNGSIDDVRIYDRVLSADEITQIYQDGF